jgi:hypothetical protein
MKLRTCKQCKATYMPHNTMQRVCGPRCGAAHARELREKKQRKADKVRREAVKTTTQLATEAQAAFNLYIRERDVDRPCISCGQSPYQGQRHASHYRSRAAASQLRFNTYNVHASCAQCNGAKSGNIVEYRIGLINKIGEDKVKWLENNQKRVKYDPEYLRRLKKIFARRARHIRKLRGQ